VSAKIRGEYWIQDGRVDFADGDVGEQNHEMVALNAIASDHIDRIFEYAEELGVDTSEFDRYDEHAFSSATEVMQAIHWALKERGSVDDAEVMKELGMDLETYKILGFGGSIPHSGSAMDPRIYMMVREGWIAVRSNNVELHGFDQEKKKNLIGGLEEILDQEGLDGPDEEVEFSLYDHKSGRSSDLTLADLKGASALRPQTMPSTTYNKILMAPADRSKPMGSMAPRSMDARTRSMLQTSENRMGFRDWLAENCGPLMVRRTWPALIASEMEPQGRRSSLGTRRSRRR
jgi:hypothetical protein